MYIIVDASHIKLYLYKLYLCKLKCKSYCLCYLVSNICISYIYVGYLVSNICKSYICVSYIVSYICVSYT